MKRAASKTEIESVRLPRPLYDRLLVKRLKEETEFLSKKALIYAAETHKEKSNLAEVLAVGEGHLLKSNGTLRPLTVKVGDHVLFGKHSGYETKVGDEEYLFIREEEVLAIL